jgi:Zn-dependent protease with chaperone function
MQEKEFVALVERLEDYSKTNPSTYRLRVALLAALGYAFLFGVVGAVLLLVAGVLYAGTINFIVIKFLIIPLGMAFVVLRSLWIENPKPEGLQLQFNDAPRLFELAKEIRVATNGPHVHKILLTNEYNAGVVQHARLGILGWPENYLVVGLPLLQALSPAEVRAVISHEFGHLSGNHGKFSGWIYRVRITWIKLLTNMQEHRRYGSGFFQSFFNWYSPYFAAYSFVLARALEFEADSISVALSGKETSARALIKLALKEKELDEDFWPARCRTADHDPDPPNDTFTAMLSSLAGPVPVDKAQIWFTQLLPQRHEYDDTHPSLAARLEAMGFPNVREDVEVRKFELNENGQGSVDYFLSMSTAEFIASENRLWKERVAEVWRERHRFVAEARLKLTYLDERSKTESLVVEQLWERASLTAQVEGYPSAIPFLNEVLQSMPDHAAANYMLGEALLESNDESGIKKIEIALEKDRHAIPSGCQLIYLFLMARQRSEEAMRYRQCVADYYAEVAAAEEERTNISKKDVFREHSLTKEMIEELKAQLSKYPKLGRAYLVKKLVKHFPEEPSFVLGVIANTPWYQYRTNKVYQQLVNDLAEQMKFPWYVYIVALEQDYKPLRKVFGKINSAEIYRS